MQEHHHTSSEESGGIAHPEQISIFGLGKNAQIDGSDVLITCVDDRRAILHELETGELLYCIAQLVSDLIFDPFAFLFDVETNEVDMVLCLPSGKASDSEDI